MSNMELPVDVLHLIKEYAKPVTRSDWRTLHKMTEVDLNVAIASNVRRNCAPVIRQMQYTQSNFVYYFLCEPDGSFYVSRIFDTRNGWDTHNISRL